MRHRAFPILDSCGGGKTRLAEVFDDVVPRVLGLLQSRCGEATCRGDGARGGGEPCTVSLSLVVGDTVEVPLTCLGRVAGDGSTATASSSARSAAESTDLVLHCAGLPGAFLAPLSALSTCRGRWRVGPSPAHAPHSSEAAPSYAQQLGALCCLEAVQRGWHKQTVLNDIYGLARRRHFAVTGTQHLLEKGMTINQEALNYSFPYHCGGSQATKRYFDVNPDVCHFYHPHAAHGTRCLSRFGTAVSVGVGCEDAASVPQLYWHPTGAMAACLAPVLSGCGVLPVGEVKLPYNGPLRESDLLTVEDVRRYMQLPTDGPLLDTTVWLCEGLFGVRPGTAWRGARQQKQGDSSASVVGVGFDTTRGEMELFLRNNTSGDIFAADDV